MLKSGLDTTGCQNSCPGQLIMGRGKCQLIDSIPQASATIWIVSNFTKPYACYGQVGQVKNWLNEVVCHLWA